MSVLSQSNVIGQATELAPDLSREAWTLAFEKSPIFLKGGWANSPAITQYYPAQLQSITQNLGLSNGNLFPIVLLLETRSLIANIINNKNPLTAIFDVNQFAASFAPNTWIETLW